MLQEPSLWKNPNANPNINGQSMVIGDYSHMTTIDEKVNYMKLARLLSKKKNLNLRTPFCTSTFTSKKI